MTRRRAVIVLGVWLVTVGLMAALEMRPAVLAMGAIVAAVAAVAGVLFDLGELPVPVDWTAVRDSGTSGRGADPRVRSLRRKLLDERRLDVTHLRATLVELVDDRLVAHHRIDRSADPVAAVGERDGHVAGGVGVVLPVEEGYDVAVVLQRQHRGVGG